MKKNLLAATAALACYLTIAATNVSAVEPAGGRPLSDQEWRRQMEALVESLRREIAALKAERDKWKSMEGETADAVATGKPPVDERLQQTEATIESLQDEVIKLKAERQKKDPKDAVKVSTKGGLKVETEDGEYSFRLSGRMQLDSVWHDQDKAHLGDGTEFRRIYLGADGQITKLWNYKIVAELSGNSNFGLNDAFIQFNGLDPFTLYVGNFKEPFSLEDQTSDLFTTHMERSLISVFSPSRHIGVMAEAQLGMATAAIGLFGGTVTDVGGDSDGPTVDTEGDEQMDIAGRVTVAPGLAKDEFIHLGLGAYYTDPADSGVRFRQRPESHVTETRYLDTGTFLDIDNFWAVQPEIAIVYGPFSVQGEYAVVQLRQKDPTMEDIDLDGWYAEASVFLTGESRVYKKGKFDRVLPKNNFLGGGFAGGLGAIQLAARLSHLDFNDPSAGLMEGEESNLTLGITWITNPYIRFMFETVFANTDVNALNSSVIPFMPPACGAPASCSAAGDDPTIYQLRGQVDF